VLLHTKGAVWIATDAIQPTLRKPKVMSKHLCHMDGEELVQTQSKVRRMVRVGDAMIGTGGIG